MSVDFDNDLLLVIMASGKQAEGLLPHVVKKWKRLRLHANSDSSKDRLQKAYPNAEITQCDLSDPRDCKKLLEGVTACSMNTPGFHPYETECGYNIIDAALANVKSAGPFKHMVHSSVIFPILRKLTHHDDKRYIEEYLIESTLPYTILQPTHLMETFNIASVINADEPSHPTFFNNDTPFSFVSCRDLGEAAANVLEQREKHFFATYQTVGTRLPMSYNDAAEIISEEIGKDVRLEPKSIEEAAVFFNSMATNGKPEEASFAMKQGPARMLLYYNDKGLIGNPNVLEMLLGRQPLEYRDWVKLNVKEQRG